MPVILGVLGLGAPCWFILLVFALMLPRALYRSRRDEQEPSLPYHGCDVQDSTPVADRSDRSRLAALSYRLRGYEDAAQIAAMIDRMAGSADASTMSELGHELVRRRVSEFALTSAMYGLYPQSVIDRVVGGVRAQGAVYRRSPEWKKQAKRAYKDQH